MLPPTDLFIFGVLFHFLFVFAISIQDPVYGFVRVCERIPRQANIQNRAAPLEWLK